MGLKEEGYVGAFLFLGHTEERKIWKEYRESRVLMLWLALWVQGPVGKTEPKAEGTIFLKALL